MHTRQSKKISPAFTLIELILVIVVFGILASISADIFAKIYDNYMIARLMNNLQTKTEITLEQIAKRLENRIKDSTIARKEANATANISPNYVFLGDADETYKILEWIGSAEEARKGMWDTGKQINVPGWSGFVDLNVSDSNNIATPGSDLNKASDIIYALSYNQISLDNTLTPGKYAALVMVGRVGDYNVSSYGWHVYTDNAYAPTVTKTAAQTLQFTTSNTDEIYEHYKLAWTAYAIVPQCPAGASDTMDCNLSLYYNFRPWQGENFYQHGTSALLAEHVTTFKFFQMGDAIRLKLCIGERFYDDNISFCKERVVF